LEARPDAGAVLHAHAPFATVLACFGRGIPAFHYMVAAAGGPIRCAPYATFGTQALAEGAVEALEGRQACLLANHGMVVIAKTPRRALELALEVEGLAEMYWRALQLGEPDLLDDEEMRRVMELFEDYGQRQ
jgi:L-fuculose-phosphate aldolase